MDDFIVDAQCDEQEEMFEDWMILYASDNSDYWDFLDKACGFAPIRGQYIAE